MAAADRLVPAANSAVSRGAPEHAGATDDELLAQVRRIEIRARRLATMLLAGDYRSVFRGAGIEFAEAREYAVGDDVRLIDWNVTARMGAPWVKLYVEERELPVVCAVDVSASQSVARSTTGRTGVAAEVAALLSFAAVYQHDRAALLTFTDQVERFVPPAHGTKHVLRIVREILRGRRGHTRTSIASACEYLARVLRRRSIVFLISDFFDQGYESSLRTLAGRHEVIAVTLVDPNDLALPDLGVVEMVDVEHGTTAYVDTGDARVRRRFAAMAAERARARHATLVSAGVDEIIVRLDEDAVRPLVAYFRTRAARR